MWFSSLTRLYKLMRQKFCCAALHCTHGPGTSAQYVGVVKVFNYTSAAGVDDCLFCISLCVSNIIQYAHLNARAHTFDAWLICGVVGLSAGPLVFWFSDGWLRRVGGCCNAASLGWFFRRRLRLIGVCGRSGLHLRPSHRPRGQQGIRLLAGCKRWRVGPGEWVRLLVLI